MNKIILSVIAALSVSLIGCGGQDNGGQDNVTIVPHWSPNDVKVSCPSGDCPQGVGAIVFVENMDDGYKVGRCTATLIAPDQVLTNSHCGKDLDYQAAYFFTRVNSQTVFYTLQDRIFDRQDITYAKGPDVGMGGDLSIFSLKQSVNSLQPRKVSRRIPADMSQLVAYVINEDGSTKNFTDLSLDRLACSTVAHEATHSGGVNDLALGLLLECSIVAGNSGSPVFTAGNFSEVQVVVNSGVDASTLWGSESFGFGNRVQCMDIPGQPTPEKICPRAYLQ